jgi:hypothetical protein
MEESTNTTDIIAIKCGESVSPQRIDLQHYVEPMSARARSASYMCVETFPGEGA